MYGPITDIAGVCLVPSERCVVAGQLRGVGVPCNGVCGLCGRIVRGVVSVAEMAEECNTSRATLKRRFARNLGTTPLGWMLSLRLGRARSLILTTDHPIKSIAYGCGFGSPSRFCKVFAERYGITPAAYRVHCRHLAPTYTALPTTTVWTTTISG